MEDVQQFLIHVSQTFHGQQNLCLQGYKLLVHPEQQTGSDLSGRMRSFYVQNLFPQTCANNRAVVSSYQVLGSNVENFAYYGTSCTIWLRHAQHSEKRLSDRRPSGCGDDLRNRQSKDFG